MLVYDEEQGGRRACVLVEVVKVGVVKVGAVEVWLKRHGRSDETPGRPARRST